MVKKDTSHKIYVVLMALVYKDSKIIGRAGIKIKQLIEGSNVFTEKCKNDVTRDENQIKARNLYEDFIQIFPHESG
jgi:hypothetical protein